MERTQVAIVGAGPAGLLLAHLLDRRGIESVVLESRSRSYVERRVRAGVLEAGAARLLRESGVGARLDREGLAHGGIHLHFAGERHRIDFEALCGRGILVYGQQEVVKDLIAARVARGGPLLFEAEAVGIEGRLGASPTVTYRRAGSDRTLAADFVAACDGSHGVGRGALLAAGARVFERTYPHAWLGLLARTPPAVEELIYAYHEHGFALHSLRSPEISRLYLQVEPDADVGGWRELRVWEELRLRLDEPSLEPGEILEMGVTPMRALVVEPMQAGRLFLAGDAAHVVPPTGAKGMNLALADVAVLADALGEWYESHSRALLDAYSATCAPRVWRTQRFSAFMTELLHRDVPDDPFAHRLRLAYLRHVVSSRAAATSLAENYTGAATDRADAVL
ncbi:MAG TPA: 4-hydroxybenzoate 3-monooxygenase [Candidatus Dormibacteraeota bacterium]|nr:4-hydroxybenzoate 3-monooxygenase [Candidatus Dormibacteraeota bacterium]